MTPQQRAQLEAINTEVNSIPYQGTQGVGEPPDLYIDEPVPGDSWLCRMYVQRKATLLREAGWPPSSLAEIICYAETGERHAVLQVTSKGEAWILDSRFPDIYPMTMPPPGYRWEAIQIAGTTQFESLA